MYLATQGSRESFKTRNTIEWDSGKKFKGVVRILSSSYQCIRLLRDFAFEFQIFVCFYLYAYCNSNDRRECLKKFSRSSKSLESGNFFGDNLRHSDLPFILGYVLVLYIVNRYSEMQTITNIFIHNLALTDFLMATLNAQFWITSLYT